MLHRPHRFASIGTGEGHPAARPRLALEATTTILPAPSPPPTRYGCLTCGNGQAAGGRCEARWRHEEDGQIRARRRPIWRLVRRLVPVPTASCSSIEGERRARGREEIDEERRRGDHRVREAVAGDGGSGDWSTGLLGKAKEYARLRFDRGKKLWWRRIMQPLSLTTAGPCSRHIY